MGKWILILLAAPAWAVSDFCPALPAPTGSIVNVTPSQAGNLPSIVSNAASNTTILLADGTYQTATLYFRTPKVTLRSQSGNRDAVIIDANYSAGEAVTILASSVTIANVTIKRAQWHPIHVAGGGHFALLYNLHIIDGGQQFIKINPDGADNDFGTIACTLMEMTSAGRTRVETVTRSDTGHDCYTGGVDMHAGWGWTIRDNTIRDIYCTSGDVAEHGIHLWNSCRDPIIERNVLINNSRGIGLGLSSSATQRVYPDNPLAGSGFTSSQVNHIGGVVRNNFIFGNNPRVDTGIGLESAWNVSVYHNTVYGAQFADIDIRFASSNPDLRNNLTGKAITLRDSGHPRINQGNVANAAAALFVNASTGDLHLVSGASSAISKGVSLGGAVPADIDGDTRDATPDVGADEYLSGGTPPANACDLDKSGLADATDLQRLANAILAPPAPSGYDINKDGLMNVRDLQMLVNVILGKAACP